jgi:hypothetical protein
MDSQLHQRQHRSVWVLLSLAMFFYLISALGSYLYARHITAADCFNPMAGDYFRSLMLVALACLDPKPGKKVAE